MLTPLSQSSLSLTPKLKSTPHQKYQIWWKKIKYGAVLLSRIPKMVKEKGVIWRTQDSKPRSSDYASDMLQHCTTRSPTLSSLKGTFISCVKWVCHTLRTKKYWRHCQNLHSLQHRKFKRAVIPSRIAMWWWKRATKGHPGLETGPSDFSSDVLQLHQTLAKPLLTKGDFHT